MDSKLASVLASVFGINVADVTLSLSKADVPNWDSLKQMDLVTSIESEYDLTLELMDIVLMTSVDAIVKILVEKGVALEH
ncbi:acyl carrier protein [Enterovibrio makurazakiensis]|uniref:acyl carrier protein n=1 Tax=Enterovibrio makurazakiensis TaxID=2910232 RepID=UPI003D246392